MITKIQLIIKIIAFRKLCLSMFRDDIDALPDEKRSSQLGDHTTETSFIEQLVLAEDHKPIDYICKLVKTPRLLKIILRHCLKTWEQLHGELDFDDLLVANVLRFAAPEAFDFILNNCNELRGLLEEGVFKNRDERQKAVEKKWKSECSRATWDTHSARQLIQFLFYGWKDQNNIIRKDAAPQGFQVSIPIDYWSRFIRGELRAEERCDQEVLRSISLWHSSPNDAHYRGKSLCVSLYEDQTFATLSERFFCTILDGHDYRRLFSHFFAYALTKHGAEANIDMIPCFTTLLSNTIQHPIDQQEHLSWVEAEIKKALPVSIQLANNIFTHFRYSSEYEYHLRSSDKDLRNNVVIYARHLFQNQPRNLLRALAPSQANACVTFAVYHSLEREGGPGFNPSDWRWFAKLLLSSAKIDKETTTPQLARFAVCNKESEEGYGLALNEDLIHKLFDSNSKRLMVSLSKDILTNQLGNDDRRIVLFAREKAKEWLSKLSSDNRRVSGDITEGALK